MRGMQVRLGMEVSGQARRFARLLAELAMELWIGDAAEIRPRRVRKKTGLRLFSGFELDGDGGGRFDRFSI